MCKNRDSVKESLFSMCEASSSISSTIKTSICYYLPVISAANTHIQHRHACTEHCKLVNTLNILALWIPWLHFLSKHAFQNIAGKATTLVKPGHQRRDQEETSLEPQMEELGQRQATLHSGNFQRPRTNLSNLAQETLLGAECRARKSLPERARHLHTASPEGGWWQSLSVWNESSVSWNNNVPGEPRDGFTS